MSNYIKKILLFPFQTISGGNYILDTNTGTVLPTNEIMLRVIELYSKHRIDEVRQILKDDYPSDILEGILNFVERWDKSFSGFYLKEQERESILNRMETFTNNDIQDYLENGNMFQIILNLTEDCNLRCKYCYLSETYKHTRNRTSNKMSVEIGIKSLEFFFNFMKPIAKRHPFKHIAVSFYGGEPILSFSNMKRFIEYSNKNSPLPIIYNVSTNGTLLTDELVDFLVANKVSVSVSLDGDKENHDRNRVYGDNRGSFNKVFTNIKRFQERYPKYKNFSIICVYDFHSDLEAIEKFFKENKLPLIVFINIVSNINTDYYNRFSNKDLETFNTKKASLLKKYIDYKINKRKISNYLQTFFELKFTTVVLRKRHLDTTLPVLPYTGACMPGFKISVRTDGIFDICERVNLTMPIGDARSGFDYDAINKIIRDYNKEVTSDCFYCPINKNCNLCFSLCMEDGKFIKADNFCNITRNEVNESFSEAYSILERRPDAFENLELRISKDDALMFYL